MNKWTPVAILGTAQFVMVLDSTVMNVSISAVVAELDTTVEAMQGAITVYSLTMAALMLLGAKLGDVVGRRRMLVIGAAVYAVGSLLTAVAPTFPVLFLGWSIVEALGAVAVIPAVAALVADNYDGRDRITAYAIIGAISGVGVAAGPLIGGFLTTYFSWRYVFAGEVVIMIVVVLLARFVRDEGERRPSRIDRRSVVLSATGLVAIIYGMLQIKEWGFVLPLRPPVIGGVALEPLGLSPVPFLFAAGGVLIWLFVGRQLALSATGRTPLLDVTLFSIAPLRAGVSVLAAQSTVIAALFFMFPVYLQLTLGLDALSTGLQILPLSLSLIVFSIVGTRLSAIWTPRRIVRIGQGLLVLSSLILVGSISLTLERGEFASGLFLAGAALGLLASQLGNVTMSSVDSSKTSEVGGIQGLFQNLGAAIGTALIGTVLISSLATSFLGSVQASTLSAEVKSQVATAGQNGIGIIAVTEVDDIAARAGLGEQDSAALGDLYAQSQVSALRTALFAIAVISAASLLFSRAIPNRLVGTPRTAGRRRRREGTTA